MVAQKGHVALIVPDFAIRAVQPARGRRAPVRRARLATWTGKDAARRLFIRRLV